MLRSRNPEFLELKNIGFKYSYQANYDEAMKCFEKALKIYPDDLQILSEMSSGLGIEDKYEELEALSRRALPIAQRKIAPDYIGRFYGCLGKFYRAKKNYNEAIKYFWLAIANKPNYVQNLHEVALCYMGKGEHRKALEILLQVKEKSPAYFEKSGANNLIKEVEAEVYEKDQGVVLLKKALAYKKEGKNSLAKSTLKKILDFEPNNMVALVEILPHIMESGEYAEGIKLAERLENLVSKPENSEWHAFYSVACQALQGGYKAIGNKEKEAQYKVLASFGEQIINASKACEEKDFEKALAEYKQAYDIKPDNYIIIDRILFVLNKLNRHKDCVNYIKRGITLAQKDNNKERLAQYAQEIADYFNKEENWQKAVQYYDKAASYSEEASIKLKNYMMAAILAISQSKLDMGLDYLKKCEKATVDGALDVYDIPSRIIKIQAYMDENSELNRALDYAEIGANHSNSGEYEKAVEAYWTSLEYIPQNLLVMDALNRALFILKRQKEGYEVAREGYVVSLRDNDFTYMEMFCYNIANYLYNQGDFPKALEYYQKAHYQNPEDKDILYFIGACYRNLKQYEKALEAFEKAHKSDPQDDGIIEQLELCKKILGK